MGILRTDVVSHSQLEGSGSVEFDGVGDYLSFGSHSAFSPATSNITIELWFYLTDGTNLSSGNYYLCDMGSNGYRFQIYNGGLYWAVDPNDYVGPINNVLSNNTWHHIAGVRDGNALELYLDGVHLGTKITTASVTSTTFTIGSYSTGGGDYEPYGYISNLRYVRGVVYKGPFTPPKFELKNIPGTIVLGCQSTTSATDFAVTPSTVTANGDAAASAFHPGLKKDITDTGVVFDGVTTFDSQAFMVPPSGKTSERNRGRGVIRGGMTPNSSALTKIAQYIEISSGGNTIDFGDGLDESYGGAGLASATRGVYNLGATSNSSPNSLVNTLEFITIANTANALDFGDLYFAIQHKAPMSNQTRGIFAAGITPTSRLMMSYITIATLGNSQDFGDSIGGSYGMNQGGQAGSSTRGLIAGGNSNSAPAEVEKIQFVTFATLGDAQDFGDLVDQNGYFNAGASSGTRALFAGGGNIGSPFATVNTIQFVTIATTGNATDFGDLTATRYGGGALSNSTRGCFVGGVTYPGATRQNIIDFVNIATTGNAKDFGDIAVVNVNSIGTMSDSHGGLS